MAPAAIVLFTQDLRVHDHPALAAAVERPGPTLPVFVHNRARMITAAFLTRAPRVHWCEGADHFHAHLAPGPLSLVP
ncbi:deoxyribodipyrimidine photo-lyase [Nocardiopsis synnemataformans]|uniref:deoxyribodipyrimidine photo-lyase n=1 Tax=Nocardiopsis synnemataformans TaxID=61305 RepID=UPI003EBF1595